MINYPIFFNGKWKNIKKNKKIIKYHPTSSNKMASYCSASKNEINLAISSSKKAQNIWQQKSKKYKFNFLIEIANYINLNKKKFAKIESREVGKPIKNAIKEIEYCIDLWKYAASVINTKHSELYEDLSLNNDAYVVQQPIGTVALITPWNFPFIVLSERLPFILAAGCSAIVKPSEFASGSILELCNFFKDRGKLSAIYSVLTGDGNVGENLVNSKSIDMVSFTGSTLNGKKIANICSKNLKRVSLELGGKNTSVILDDVDIDKVSKVLSDRIFYNASQACVAPSKILVHKKILKKFKKKFINIIKKKKAKHYGPITTKQNFDKIMGYYKYAKKNEKIIYDGNIFLQKKYFEPVILENVSSKSKIYDDEIFGPIIFINEFLNTSDLIKKVNNTKYGLASYIFSSSKEKSILIAKEINCGRIWINSFKDFPQLTIGGHKESGAGRESGLFGITNYSEFKSIVIGKN